MKAIFYLANIIAAIMIFFAWYKISTLRRRIPGGLVRATCNLLGQFVGLFAFSFVALESFPLLPVEFRGILISIIIICTAVISITLTNFFSAIAANSGY